MSGKFKSKWLEKEDMEQHDGSDEEEEEQNTYSPSEVESSGGSWETANSPTGRAPRKSKKKKGIEYKRLESIQFSSPASILIAGLTKCGKTKWLRSFVLNNHQHYDRIYAFSSSAKYNEDYNFLEPNRILDPSVVDDLLKLKRIVTMQKKVREKGHKYQLLLIFDDIVGVINTHGGAVGKFFDKIVTSGRHIGISCVFITQRLTKISPTIRDNCLYWVVIKLKMNEILDQVFTVQSMFTDKYRFWDYYLEITKERYSSLLIQCDNPYDPSCIPLAPVQDVPFHIDDNPPPHQSHRVGRETQHQSRGKRGAHSSRN
jgi:hypothetical protein